MRPPTPPRLYCIPATEAPVVAVFRRGPTDWAHVGRWDLAALRYEPGAWLRGRIFPRRSDLSPDGQYLSYFAHKPGADWEHGDAYVAISKLPWLTALHAFGTCGTWTRGYHFVEPGETAGDETAETELPIPFALHSTPIAQFACERRRGWEESLDSPARVADDVWDERRNARLEKRQPGGDGVLHVESLGWAGGEFARQAVDGLRVRYSLESDGALVLLDELQWADWHTDGRLLVATHDGRLQVRSVGPRGAKGGGASGGAIDFDEDLGGRAPDPAPAPDWATSW
jgi:hypothetical protein